MEESNQKYLSTSVLAKLIKMERDDLFNALREYQWIIKENNKWVLLSKSQIAGAKYRSNEKGQKWVVWPTSIINNSTFKSEISGDVQLVKRRFRLPGIDDLNKDQDKVLRLPEDGQFLIVGGPGTGKSVVALLRTFKYNENNDYAFLTFNKVLLTSTKQLVNFSLKSFTLDSWLGKAYWNIFKEYIPDIEGSERKPDYDQIIKNLESKSLEEKSYHIIIDEGQDKPRKYYETLMYFGIENFFIVADQNQQITEDNSSRQELTDLLGLEVEDVIELKENYRNSHPIGLLSNSFFTDPSSPAPDLPSKSGSSLKTPILYEYSVYQDCAKLILREADRDNSKLIGVVVKNNVLREMYVDALESTVINLDNPRPTISTYFTEDRRLPNINFGYGGIVVLNDKSIKGLEFDVVFIIIDGFEIHNNDIDSMKKRFYVMSSRAIEKLVFFKSKEYNGEVEQILPDDESILKREVLING